MGRHEKTEIQERLLESEGTQRVGVTDLLRQVPSHCGYPIPFLFVYFNANTVTLQYKGSQGIRDAVKVKYLNPAGSARLSGPPVQTLRREDPERF